MAKKKAKRTQSRARHSYDPNLSPVGWYVGSFLLRFVEIGAKGNNNPKRRFLSWQNTILVKAKSLDHAFEKVVKVANSQTTPYKGGPDGIPVQWIFEGVTELLPVYDVARRSRCKLPDNQPEKGSQRLDHVLVGCLLQ